MVDFSVVRFCPEDIPFGKSLTDLEGWNRTTADWESLLRLEPDGVFKAVSDGKDAGIAGVLSYGRLAWIHSVVVLPEHRRKGLARALMMHCIRFARGKGSECIKLDAVPEVKLFYKGLGFVEEFESKRFTRSGEMCLKLAEKMKPADLDDVFAFDHIQTGLNRARVLKDVFRENQKWAFVVKGSTGIRGYALAREGDVRVNIGPCVCVKEDERCAMDLLKTIIGQAPERGFRVCMSGANARAVKVFRSLKFQESEGSTRMFMGKAFHETESNYAMISAEKG